MWYNTACKPQGSSCAAADPNPLALPQSQLLCRVMVSGLNALGSCRTQSSIVRLLECGRNRRESKSVVVLGAHLSYHWRKDSSLWKVKVLPLVTSFYPGWQKMIPASLLKDTQKKWTMSRFESTPQLPPHSAEIPFLFSYLISGD